MAKLGFRVRFSSGTNNMAISTQSLFWDWPETISKIYSPHQEAQLFLLQTCLWIAKCAKFEQHSLKIAVVNLVQLELLNTELCLDVHNWHWLMPTTCFVSLFHSSPLCVAFHIVLTLHLCYVLKCQKFRLQIPWQQELVVFIDTLMCHVHWR